MNEQKARPGQKAVQELLVGVYKCVVAVNTRGEAAESFLLLLVQKWTANIED